MAKDTVTIKGAVTICAPEPTITTLDGRTFFPGDEFNRDFKHPRDNNGPELPQEVPHAWRVRPRRYERRKP